MDDMQVRIFFYGGTHSAQRYKVLAAQQQRQLSVRQNLCRARFNIRQSGFRTTEAQLHIAAVKHGAVR